MQILKKISLAAVTALALAGTTGAQAAAEMEQFFISPTSTSTDGSVTYFAFDSEMTDTSGNTPTHVAGDTFTDDFIFSSFDPSDAVSAVAFTNFTDQLSNQVSFSTVGLYTATFPAGAAGTKYSFASSTITPNLGFSANGAVVPLGLYLLRVTGTFLVADADYSGLLAVSAASPVSAVPEPASWTLMLAGAGAMFAVSRRRNNRQA